MAVSPVAGGTIIYRLSKFVF